MAGKAGTHYSRPMSQAQRDSLALTNIEKILDLQGQSRKPPKIDPVRLKALEMRYSRLRPVLSAVENTSVDLASKLSEADILAKIAMLVDKHPDLIQRAIEARKAISELIPVVIEGEAVTVDGAAHDSDAPADVMSSSRS